MFDILQQRLVVYFSFFRCWISFADQWGSHDLSFII